MTTTYTSTVDLIADLYDLPKDMQAFQAPEVRREELRRQFARVLVLVGEDPASRQTHLLREHLFLLCGMPVVPAMHLFRVDYYDISDTDLIAVRTNVLKLLVDELHSYVRSPRAQCELEHGCSMLVVMRYGLLQRFFVKLQSDKLRERFPNFVDYMIGMFRHSFDTEQAWLHATGRVDMTPPYQFDEYYKNMWYVVRRFGLPSD